MINSWAALAPFFIIGLFIGSFLNVVINRLHTGEQFLHGRSKCPKCKKVINWYDNIPLISWLLLRAKCRNCKAKISIQYPLVELSTGVLFALFAWKVFGSSIYMLDTGVWFGLILALFYASALVIIFVYDLKYLLILDKITYPLVAIALLVSIVGFGPSLTSAMLGALTAGGFFGLLVILSKGIWMGLGDVKLGVVMGFILGFPNVLAALAVAYVIGGIFGVILLATGKKGPKSQIAFGTFLVVGTFTAMLWGEGMINWYLGMIGV